MSARDDSSRAREAGERSVVKRYEALPSVTDPRVRAVWEAFKAEGWIIASLKQAQVAVAVLDAQQPLGAVSGSPEERIAAVLHTIGFGAERHALAREMLKLAHDYPERGR